MPQRFAPHELRDKALAAIEEAAERAKAGPVERTKALSFALAYLWSTSGGERWPFDWFWESIAEEHDIGRTQNVWASLNAVKRVVG